MAVVAVGVLVAGSLASLSPAAAAPAARAAAFIDLGSAASYSVLAGAGVTNTGNTVLALDLGLSPAGAISGFPPGIVTGTVHDKDAAAEQAQADRQEAYDAAAAQGGGTAFAGDQAGAVVKPGLYTSAAAVTNTGTMTLDADGDASAVFVFQIGAAFSTAAASKIVLSDGALANNVYWQVLGATSFGAGAKAVGTFLGTGAISLGEGASVKGRLLTPSTVGLANSPVTQPIDDLTAPVVTIDGGAKRSTRDTSPVISGTTDEPVGGSVVITVGEQTLTSEIDEDGGWSASAVSLPEASYDVVASVTDASQNTGTDTQTLVVDVTAPDIAITGGAKKATRDSRPTVAGTTEDPASTVTVRVDGQVLTSPVGPAGGWNVRPTALDEGNHNVVATVSDAAQNSGRATQILTVDQTVPVVTLDGGATRSTKDSSPWIDGTTAEKAGTTVDVTVANQTLTATVRKGGAWGVSARPLAEGRHKVVATVTDAAKNTGSVSQVLTVGDGGPGPGPGPDPQPARDYRPDAGIRSGKGAFVGAGSYGDGQRVAEKLGGKHRRAVFEVRLANKGDVADRMAVRGTAKNKKFTVTYLVGGKDVTRQVVAGTYRTATLAPGKSMLLVVKVRRTSAAKAGDHRAFEVRAISTHATSKRDTVAAVVRR